MPTRIDCIRSFRELLLMIAILSIAAPAQMKVYASDDLPPWQHNLQCDKNDQKYKGLEYCTQQFLNSTFHVIVVDLTSAGIALEYILVEGNDRYGVFDECKDVNIPLWSTGDGCKDPKDGLYPVMAFGDAVNRAEEGGAAVVINGDYSACTVYHSTSCPSGKYRSHGPEGLTVVGGNRLDGPINGDIDENAVNRPWFAVGESPNLQVEIDILVGKDSKEKPFEWIYTGMGGGPWLIKDGTVQGEDIDDCTNLDKHSCTSYVAQTALGISQDKNYLYLVAAKGQNAKGIAEFMAQQLHLWRAIKLDGGGSTELWYAGKEEPFVLMGDGRPLTNYLAVIAGPGSGIDVPGLIEEPSDDQEQEPEDGWSTTWVDQIREAWTQFTQWLTELPSLPGRLWDQMVDLLVERFTAWAEEKIQELIVQTLPQCCLGLALPLGGVVMVVTRYHRKRTNSS